MSASSLSGGLAWAGAIAFSCLVLVAGLDRAGAGLPGMGPFSQSHRAKAVGLAIEQGQPATTLASELVHYAPVRQGHLSLLALSLALEGDADGASAALAGGLATGWRDTLAQALAVEQAIRGNEPDIAALRMEAMLRNDPQSDVTQGALRLVAADAPARAALAAAMARNETWATNVLNGAAALDSDGFDDRLALVAAAREQGYRADPLGARRFAQILFERDPEAAWAAWTALVGPGDRAATGLWQGGVAGMTDAEQRVRAPFEWRRIPGSTLRLETEGEALVVEGSASGADTIAIQHVSLAPGSYALAWNTAARSPGEPAITLALQCPASPASLQLGPVLAIEDRFARSAQLSSPCTVAVRVMSVSGTSGERRLENVVLGRSG